MKRMLVVLLVLCATAAFAGDPGYYFGELIDNFSGADSVKVQTTLADGTIEGVQSAPHGVVVDNEGKLWVGFHNGYSRMYVKANGDTISLKGLHCFMPDGTPASFSPIEFLEFEDGSKDTIYGESTWNGSNKGITMMSTGEILATCWMTLYKIDPTTGEGIASWTPDMDGLALPGSMTEAAHDPVAGLVYFGYVSAGKPIYALDEDLVYVATAVDTSPTLHRSIVARTKDGISQIFTGTIWNGQGIFVFESDDPEFTPFELVDTLGVEVVETDSNTITYKAWASCMDWCNQDEGILLYGNYFSAKVYTDTLAAPVAKQASKWVIMDVDDGTEIAEFGATWPIGHDFIAAYAADSLGNQPASLSPRGASVSVDGDNYQFVITDFDLGLVQRVVWSATGIKGNDRYVPYGFALEQNYPNPFNPTTSISFNIPESFNVSVDVYSLNGAKVATVYNGRMEAGSHNMTFDASNLASGTYVYQLTAGSYTVSRKMTLVK